MKDLGDTSFVLSFRYLEITLKVSFRCHKRFISIKLKINWHNKLYVTITERDFQSQILSIRKFIKLSIFLRFVYRIFMYDLIYMHLEIAYIIRLFADTWAIQSLNCWKATLRIIKENKRAYAHIRDLTIWRSFMCQTLAFGCK